MVLLYSPLVTMGVVYFILMPGNYAIFIVILVKYKDDWKVRRYSIKILHCIYLSLVALHIFVAVLFRQMFLS